MRGFEDALELALYIMSISKSVEEARKHLEDVLYSIKEIKIEKMRQRLMLIYIRPSASS